MHQILVLGAGKIGTLISYLLATSNVYQVHLADILAKNPLQDFAISHLNYVSIDANNASELSSYIKKNKIEAVISSLPFYANPPIAKMAAEQAIHYFDLTEDVKVTQSISEIAKNAKHAFVPQCGLAPGFISIIANHLMKDFDELDSVKMRVGALPATVSNALSYALTWSTDGLINEYGNACRAIENGQEVLLKPLADLETIMIDGAMYEAFNTSGGIGSLGESYLGKIKHLNYKTIRYPGHCEKMKFLMNDLALNQDRKTLKSLLEKSVPRTNQDLVIVYVSVTGIKNHQLFEKHYVKKFYAQTINEHVWSAIQITTASSLCTIVDLVLSHPTQYQGLIRLEQFSYDDFIRNSFGQFYI